MSAAGFATSLRPSGEATNTHYSARVASHAVGGEVLVSSLVRELVAGSGVGFLKSREVELKGLDGSHQLFAVDLS